MSQTPIMMWPCDAEGNPMVIVTGYAKDEIPTVRFGNVEIGPSVMRPVPNGTDEEIINAMRQAQRMAEYVCGIERRLLQWAQDPTTKFASPIPEGEAFSAPPEGYDPSSMPPHPADAANGVVKS